MKRRIKIALGAAGLIGFAAGVNALIYKAAAAGGRYGEGGRYWRWRYGRVRYVVRGKVSAPPLLLVHAPGTSLLEWERCIALLSRDYRVYAPDLLGFGYSDKPNLSYSAYLYTSLIRDFAAEVIRKPAYAAASGHSGSALLAAARMRPGLFRKLLLVNPAGLGRSGELPTPLHALLGRVLRLPVLGESLFNLMFSKTALGYFLKTRCYAKPDTPVATDRFYYPAHHQGQRHKYAMSALLSGYLNTGMAALLKGAAMPVHIIWGGAVEVPGGAEDITVIKGLNPGITLLVVENAGLLPHDENPEAFALECGRFFEGALE